MGVSQLEDKEDRVDVEGSESEAMNPTRESESIMAYESMDDIPVDVIDSETEMFENDSIDKQSSASARVQDTLPFGPVKPNSLSTNPTQAHTAHTESRYDNDLHAVHEKLDVLMSKREISSQFTKENLPEAVESLDVLKNAVNIADINGSGISFLPRKR